MSKGFRLVTMVALSLVLLVGISLVACEEEEPEALQDLDMSLYQYLKGATVDMDDATLNSMAEGGGEGGANSMGMGYSPALAGLLPACKEYANLGAQPEAAAAVAGELAYDAAIAAGETEAEAVAAREAAEAKTQKEVVSEWLVGFLGYVDAGIADPDTTLQENEAYKMLNGLTAAAWFGLWSQGAWPAKQAFWKVWPDPAGRGGQCEFTDHVALNGLTAYGNYTWAGGALKYAEQTADNRALIDADLTAFYATLEAECTAAAVTAGATAWLMANAFAEMMEAVAAATAAAAEGGDFNAAYSAHLGTNYPLIYQGMVAASFAVAEATEAYAILYDLNQPAADGWATDIGNGVHPRQALFRWIAKGAVSAMGAAGPLIELSVGEFSFKITNPNEYFVSIDNLSINISVNSDGFGYYPAIDVDAAKLAIGDKIWIPAAKDGVDGEVIVKLSAPIKWMDMITWMVMAGYDGTTGGTYVTDVWGKIHPAGTAVFDVTVEATISSEEETITQSFDLTWTPAA